MKNGTHDVFVQLGASNHSKEIREIEDFYATEPKAVEMLLNKESFSSNVWECACGQGHISEVLKSHGYNVYSSDLIDRGYGLGGQDFLKYQDKINCDIITNPPYKIALDFIKHALEITSVGNKVAFLLKIQFLESDIRRNFFEINPPKYVYVFSKRTNCAKNGDFETYKTNAICYAWYIWENGFHGEPVIRWL